MGILQGAGEEAEVLRVLFALLYTQVIFVELGRIMLCVGEFMVGQIVGKLEMWGMGSLGLNWLGELSVTFRKFL